MARRMCGIRKADKIKNCGIRRTGGRDVGEIIKNLKWKYTGHIMRREKDRSGRTLLNWRPYDDGKRRRGRPHT